MTDTQPQAMATDVQTGPLAKLWEDFRMIVLEGVVAPVHHPAFKRTFYAAIGAALGELVTADEDGVGMGELWQAMDVELEEFRDSLGPDEDANDVH